MIELVRVDDRLIHGQVAIGWVSSIGANTILVANDAAQADKTQAMALKMGTPAGVKLYIRKVADSGEIVRNFAAAQKARVMVIVKSIADAARIVNDSGGVITSVNVGGQRAEAGKQKLTEHASASAEEIECLRQMHDAGVELDFRMLPRDSSRTYEQVMKNVEA